jgi:hypothetical protein
MRRCPPRVSLKLPTEATGPRMPADFVGLSIKIQSNPGRPAPRRHAKNALHYGEFFVVRSSTMKGRAESSPHAPLSHKSRFSSTRTRPPPQRLRSCRLLRPQLTELPEFRTAVDQIEAVRHISSVNILNLPSHRPDPGKAYDKRPAKCRGVHYSCRSLLGLCPPLFLRCCDPSPCLNAEHTLGPSRLGPYRPTVALNASAA